MSTNIYQFLDPSEYLRAVWEKKKEKNPLFSIRAWAKQLQFPNHTIVYEILHGKRGISTRYLPAIVTNLKLDQPEATYLEALVNLKKARKEEEREYCKKKVDKMRAIDKMSFTEIENFHPLQDPIYILLLEYFSLKNACTDGDRIRKCLRISRTTIEIDAAISKLTNLGFLRKTADGYQRINNHITSQVDIPSSAVKSFHQSLIQMASNQLVIQDVKEREYGSYMFNIKKNNLPKAKETIRSFIKTFMEEFEESSGDETYNLGIQLFALTQQSGEQHD